jgi:hypothetical protein
MSRPNILTVRDLLPKVIVDVYRVILIVLLVALLGTQSEKQQRILATRLVNSFGRLASVFSYCAASGAASGYLRGSVVKIAIAINPVIIVVDVFYDGMPSRSMVKEDGNNVIERCCLEDTVATFIGASTGFFGLL